MLKVAFKDTLTPALLRISRKFPAASQQAAEVTGLAILDDAVTVAPTPPIDTGFLRGAGFVRVDGVVTFQMPDAQAENGPAQRGRIVVDVGFNTPYAFYQHEGLPPGPGVEHPVSGERIKLSPGPKSEQAGNVGGWFLVLKLNQRRDRYARIYADRLGRNMRRSA